MSDINGAIVDGSKQNFQLGGDADWWKSAVIYQIYPRSYLDSNQDGIGDLPGIIQKLDYLEWLGVDALWISPFFTSPMKDFGYDVSDYRDVDPMFGSLADFDELLAKAHERGIRILIDLVLSHTSDQHVWYQESRQSRDNPKADWYVWEEPKPDGSPPTNWMSIFGGSAWEWDAMRRQYFLHNFLTSQPDLNFHNPEVRAALIDVARFWLDRGVDGFRLDTANMYFHDDQLRDNPPLAEGMRVNGIDETNPYSMQEPKYNISRPENLAFLEDFRGLLDEYPAVTTVGELGAVTDMYEIIADYTESGKRLHMAYSFDFMTKEYNASHIRSVVEKMSQRGGTGWPCWAFSNHDVVRSASRWGTGTNTAPLISALLMSLGGTACLYQGEELGLLEADVPFEALQDPFGIRFWPGYKGRDGCRTPMLWVANAEHGGFTKGKPWLPVATEQLSIAVDQQIASNDSVLGKTRQFIQWRKGQSALLNGSIRFLDAGEAVVTFIRELDGVSVLCVFNLGKETANYAYDQGKLSALEGHGFESVYESNMIQLPVNGAFFGAIEQQS